MLMIFDSSLEDIMLKVLTIDMYMYVVIKDNLVICTTTPMGPGIEGIMLK